MRKIQFVCLLAVLVALVSLSPAARAQVETQKYASPTGTGNACTVTAPCPLQIAVFDAPDGGIVSCIDGGTYEFNIPTAFSRTIDCPGAVFTSFSDTTLVFNGPSSQVVVLRNLTFHGGPQKGTPFIKVTGGATLIIENCKFQNIANGNSIAIQFQPSGPAAQLIIRDSVFANNGVPTSTGGGLQVAPAAGGSASVSLERVSFNYNITGMVLSGPVNATMINSTVQASRQNGILVGSGSTLVIKDSTLMYNVGAAVSVASGGTLRLSNNDIESNQVGISNSGGQALTYANNRIFANGSTATLTPVQGGQ